MMSNHRPPPDGHAGWNQPPNQPPIGPPPDPAPRTPPPPDPVPDPTLPSDWAPRPSDPWDGPPSGHPTGHPPAPVTRSGPPLWGKLLMGFIVAMLAFLVLMGGCSYLIYRSIRPVVDEANEMMADLADENYVAAAAHASTAPDCFGDDPAQRLADRFTPNPVVTYDLTGGGVSSGNDRSGGNAWGVMTLVNTGTRDVNLELVEEDGGWKVCSISGG